MKKENAVIIFVAVVVVASVFAYTALSVGVIKAPPEPTPTVTPAPVTTPFPPGGPTPDRPLKGKTVVVGEGFSDAQKVLTAEELILGALAKKHKVGDTVTVSGEITGSRGTFSEVIGRVNDTRLEAEYTVGEAGGLEARLPIGTPVVVRGIIDWVSRDGILLKKSTLVSKG